MCACVCACVRVCVLCVLCSMPRLARSHEQQARHAPLQPQDHTRTPHTPHTHHTHTTHTHHTPHTHTTPHTRTTTHTHNHARAHTHLGERAPAALAKERERRQQVHARREGGLVAAVLGNAHVTWRRARVRACVCVCFVCALCVCVCVCARVRACPRACVCMCVHVCVWRAACVHAGHVHSTCPPLSVPHAHSAAQRRRTCRDAGHRAVPVVQHLLAAKAGVDLHARLLRARREPARELAARGACVMRACVCVCACVCLCLHGRGVAGQERGHSACLPRASDTRGSKHSLQIPAHAHTHAHSNPCAAHSRAPPPRHTHLRLMM
jgi:hypothetical protein